MEIIYDLAKSVKNLEKHGLDLSAADCFDWDGAIMSVDERFDYGETRFVALGLIGTRLHSLVFSVRNGKIRAISLRKANKREVSDYENSQ